MKEESKVFINGRSQAINMLKMLTKVERDRILSKIKIKNPSLATELNSQCVNFSDIQSLNDDSLQSLLPQVQAEVLGLALKNSPIDLQRRVLTLSDRAYAEKAYRVLKTPLSSSKMSIIERAQNKVISIFSRHLDI